MEILLVYKRIQIPIIKCYCGLADYCCQRFIIKIVLRVVSICNIESYFFEESIKIIQ